MKKQLWIGIYHHRHGVDVCPYFQEEPLTEEQIIEVLGDEYEGPGGKTPEEDVREEEYVEVAGPWEIPVDD
jgi:hypothetical protein